jgi:hypothetical protein
MVPPVWPEGATTLVSPSLYETVAAEPPPEELPPQAASVSAAAAVSAPSPNILRFDIEGKRLL